MALTNNMCRCCMIEDNNDGNIELLSIFSKLQDTISLKDILKEAIPRLKVSDEDRLPKKVCLNCLEAVKEIYQFQQNCLKNEEKFCEMLMVKKEQSEVDFSDTAEAYFEDIITKLDSSGSPLPDDFAREVSSPAFEDLKLNIDKIEKDLNSEDDFVESCSDFSLDLEHESDEEDVPKKRKKRIQNATSKKRAITKASEIKVEKTDINPKHLTNKNSDLDSNTDLEDVVESDFSLDLGDSDYEDEQKSNKKTKAAKPAKSLQSLLFACEKCEKTFRTPLALNRHLDWHRKLTCDVCGEGRRNRVFQFFSKPY